MKIIKWIGIVIFCIIIFGLFIFTILKIQEARFNDFNAELEELIEIKTLTEFQLEKLEYKTFVYRINGEKGGMPLSCNIIGFEQFLKQTDYDFWYEIKFIFEE